jgi:hypothetical protein
MKTLMRVMLAGLVSISMACGDDPDPVDPAAEAALVGTYSLSAVNGGTLPFTYATTATARFEVISGQIIVEADHDFTDILTTRETTLAGGAESDAVDTYLGTWVLRADSVRFSYPGRGVQMMGVTPSTLTVKAQGLTLTYSK